MKENNTLNWMSVASCPACSCEKFINSGKLLPDSYYFGNENIGFDGMEILVYECLQCGLFYKSLIPSPKYLSEVFERQAGNVWQSDYNYSNESHYISKLIKDVNDFDLLDIGPANGGLLKAFIDTSGRRSGLDIVKHPGLSSCLKGEFIDGLLDGNLQWSKKEYDVVTVYDVFEHLYDPQQALQNLYAFLKPGGYLIIETGDADSFWPKKYGVNNWWYSSLFEHHVFWNSRSIRYHSNVNNFEVVDISHLRHKNRRHKPWFKKLNRSVLGILVWLVSSKLFIHIKKYLGGYVVQPRDLFTCDHMLIVLRKK